MSESVTVDTALQDLVRSLQEHQEAISAVVERFHRVIEEVACQVERSTKALEENLQSALQSALMSVPRLDLPSLSAAFEQFNVAIEQLPGRMRDALSNLGQAGWYLDPEMSLPEIFEFGSVLASRHPDAGERELADYYRERLEAIQRALAARHPHRARILDSAFAAHARGEFDLSVPVFLAQADGICQEAVSLSPYSLRNHRPQLASYAQSLAADSIRAAALHPLTGPLPLTVSASDRGSVFDALNRHQVLHGESVSYGSEINSLKAISFINYISYMFS